MSSSADRKVFRRLVSERLPECGKYNFCTHPENFLSADFVSFAVKLT